MPKTKRVAQAPEEPLPELDEFLALFQFKFRRRESRDATERYLTGLLTEHPNKNCDTLAAVVPGTSEQQLQGLLTDMVWDEVDLTHQRVEVLKTLHTEGDGVLVFDDTGFAKQGKASVGVARQYSGTLGKVGNCQVTVNCHYAERTVAWPVNTRLYLPGSWANDPARRAKAQVPAEVGFQTKAEIALGLLDEARSWAVKHACVVADADYGDNPAFLNGLEARRERMVVAIRANFTVATARRTSVAGQRADDVAGVLIDPLLLNRASCVMEKILDFGLTLPGSHSTACEAISHQRPIGQIHFQRLGETRAGEQRGDDQRSRDSAGQSSI